MSTHTTLGTRRHLIMAVLDRREASTSPAEQNMLDVLADELIRYTLADGLAPATPRGAAGPTPPIEHRHGRTCWWNLTDARWSCGH